MPNCRIEEYEKPVTIDDEFYGVGNVLETRWRIVDAGSKTVIDDAQGYGYKSFEAARKALWHRENRGKIARSGAAAGQFFRKHRDVLLDRKYTDILIDIHEYKETGRFSGKNEKCYWEEVSKVLPESESLERDVKKSVLKLVYKNI